MEEIKDLRKGIAYFDKAIEYFSICDSVNAEEYNKMTDYIEEFEKRLIKLEIENENVTMEVV